MNESEIKQLLSQYKFYHIIQLTENIKTQGNPVHVRAQNLCMKFLKSIDLKEKRVLDIGCRDGLFSFAAESMGASEIIGIDNDISKPAIEFLIPFFNSQVKMYEMNLYELKATDFGLFDVVIFPGVLYHLRYPFWALKTIRDVLKVGGNLIIETAIWQGEPNNAMLFCPVGSDSPYEPTSCTFFNEKGLVDTLNSMGFKISDIEYVYQGAYWQTIKGRSERFMTNLKAFLTDEYSQPIKRVNRGVFNCTFDRYDRESSFAEYWDQTHDIHTKYGG